MNRWVLLRSRQNFSLYSGGAVCERCVEGLLEIGYLCSIELFQIRFNYSLFFASLSLSSSCRLNRMDTVLTDCMNWIERVSEFSPMMRLMMCNLRVLKFDFSLFWTPHAREWIFNLTRKWKTVSASSEKRGKRVI